MASAGVDGKVEPGFEGVRDAFAKNFAEHGEVGAAFCLYVDGRSVVDVWGGVADQATGRPLASLAPDRNRRRAGNQGAMQGGGEDLDVAERHMQRSAGAAEGEGGAGGLLVFTGIAVQRGGRHDDGLRPRRAGGPGLRPP